MTGRLAILTLLFALFCLGGQQSYAQEVITVEPDTVLSSDPLPAYEDEDTTRRQANDIIIIADTLPPGPVYNNLADQPVEEVGVITLRPDRRIPGRASVLSAVLPGLGQVYNGKYWKVPVIYGGFAMFGYLIKFNNDNYQEFRAALFAEIDGDEATVNPFDGILNESSLRRRTDRYRRDRDFSMILTGMWYLLNIVEAHVDAHLQEFDVSDDISMKIGPTAGQNGTLYAGVGLTIIID